MKTNSIYKSAKPKLKAKFEDFVAHPDQYSDDPDLIHAIKESNPIERLALWKVYRESAKTFLHEKGLENFDDRLVEDLKDATLKPMNGAILKLILKHPSADEFNLEPEMIETIKGFSKDERKDAFNSMQQKLGFVTDAAAVESDEEVHDKVLKVLAKIWDKASPLFGKVFGVLVDIGTKLLSGLIDDKVSGDVGKELISGVGLTGNIIKDSLQGDEDDTVEAAGGD